MSITSYQRGEIVMQRNGLGAWNYAVITHVDGDKWEATEVLSPAECALDQDGRPIPPAPSRSYWDADLGHFEISRHPSAAELAAAPEAVLLIQQEVGA